MRVTKTRQQRAKTINPNPPICRSKEMTFTYVNFFDCVSNLQLRTIQKYGLTYEEAVSATSAPAGQYSIGYFYQPDFHVFEALQSFNCAVEEWRCVTATRATAVGVAHFTISGTEAGGITTPGQWWAAIPPDSYNAAEGEGDRGMFLFWDVNDPGPVLTATVQLDLTLIQTAFFIGWSLTTNIEVPPDDPSGGYYGIAPFMMLGSTIDFCTNETEAEILAKGWTINAGPFPTLQACLDTGCGT